IQWKDITLLERWQLEAIAPTPKLENTKPDFIAQNTDGTPNHVETAYYLAKTTQPTPTVHQALYQRQPQPQPDSPTHTNILGFTNDRQINVLSKEFVLDKELLKYDYLKPENTNRKNQFFKEYNELEKSILRTKYYEMVTCLQIHFSFFDFLDYHNKIISVIEKTLSWTKTENHEKVYQTYPPFESIILNQNSEIQVLATPIKNPSLSDDNKNLDSITQ
ncbi:hypothetical protein CFP56_024680, partial [Quercus suber]